MRVQQTGPALIKKSFKIKNVFHAVTMAIVIVGGILTAPALHAQEQTSRPKPQLAEVNLVNSNDDNLDLAQKLNPDFFEVDEQTFNGDGKFYALNIPLDPQNPNRFLLLTVRDTFFYCTSYGCPHYIYENIGNNQWKLALSLQSHGLYYDVNSTSSRPRNLISEDTSNASRKIGIWVWNGQNYQKAIRR